MHIIIYLAAESYFKASLCKWTPPTKQEDSCMESCGLQTNGQEGAPLNSIIFFGLCENISLGDSCVRHGSCCH